MTIWSASPSENHEQWFVWDIYSGLPPKPVFFGSMEDAGLVADALNKRLARAAALSLQHGGKAQP